MGSSPQDKGSGEGRAAQPHPLQECGWLAAGRVGGEGRCLAAEVRPYLELAECLSPSRVRGEGVVGSGEGEEETQLLGGGGGLRVEGPKPWETLPCPSTNSLGEWGAGGVPAAHKDAPHSLPQPGTGHPPYRGPHFQSSFTTTQQARSHYPH